MKLYVNANENLTIIKGVCVFELPINSMDAFNIIAVREYGDESAKRAIEKLLAAICTSCKIGNRHELELIDSPIMRVTNGAYRVNTSSYTR